MRTTNLLLIGVSLVVAPLSAQDQVGTIRVDAPAVEITNDHPITNEITLELPPPDSASIARDEASERAMNAISDYLATCGCVDSGPSNVSVVTNIGITAALFFIGWQLKGIKDKGPDTHNEGDTNVEVNVPPHDHKKPKDDDRGEGNGHD